MRLLSHELANEFWRYPEPRKKTRDDVYQPPELEWMHMEENQPDVLLLVAEEWSTTTCTDGVEPSSFAAADDGLPVLLNSSFSTAYPGDHQETRKSSDVPVEEPERWPNWRNFQIWRMNFRIKVSSGASRPTKE